MDVHLVRDRFPVNGRARLIPLGVFRDEQDHRHPVNVLLYVRVRCVRMGPIKLFIIEISNNVNRVGLVLTITMMFNVKAHANKLRRLVKSPLRFRVVINVKRKRLNGYKVPARTAPTRVRVLKIIARSREQQMDNIIINLSTLFLARRHGIAKLRKGTMVGNQFIHIAKVSSRGTLVKRRRRDEIIIIIKLRAKARRRFVSLTHRVVRLHDLSATVRISVTRVENVGHATNVLVVSNAQINGPTPNSFEDCHVTLGQFYHSYY